MSVHLSFLRKCRVCGEEADSIGDLDKFSLNPLGKYNRKNLCKRCEKNYHTRWRNRPEVKKRIKVRKSKAIDFKGTWVNFSENPRSNKCSICGKKYPEELDIQTALHHEFYDEQNPLAHTVEVCNSCHSKVHGFGIKIGISRGDLT